MVISMSKDWTIDTIVLYKAANTDTDACYFLLNIIEKGDGVVFDFEGRIVQEYNNCLRKIQNERKGSCELVQKWFKHVVAKLAKKCSGKLQQRHKTKFIELNFDSSDWPFVAVCSKTISKKLVSEDSDYTIDVKNYLLKEMKVSVLSVHNCLNRRML